MCHAKIRLFVAVLLDAISIASFAAARSADGAALPDGARVFADSRGLCLEIDGATACKKPAKWPVGDVRTTVEAEEMADGAFALRAVARDAAGTVYEVVAVRAPGAREPRIVWNELCAPEGDPGERVSWGSELVDLSADKKAEIVVGRRYEPARLCGLERRELLFRRVWDLARGKLRPVLARRPGIEPSADLVGVVEDGEPRPSLFRAATPVAVSSVARDGGDPLFLTPPAGLVDGDPATAWIPATGNGAGEFVTFSTATTIYGATSISVRRRPEGAKPGAFDLPASLLLVFEGAVFRLRFEANAAEDATVRFELPHAVRSGCMSIVLEESVAPGRGRPLALAEVAVLTEVDSEGGLERVARDLADAERAEQAVSVLVRAGAAAVAPIEAAWERLDLSGRRRAVRVIASAAPGAAVELMAGAAMEADEVLREAAIESLARSGDEGALAVAARLDAKDDAVFAKAARILSTLDAPRAFEALLRSAGEGSRERRRLSRELIVRAARVGEGRVAMLLEAIGRTEEQARSERGLDLLRAAAALTETAGETASRCAALFAGAKGFETRYRLLEALAATASPEALPSLIQASNDEDPELRRLAVEALAVHATEPAAGEAIVAALSDEAPRVRLAALEALAKARILPGAVEALRALVSTDRWPAVRALAARRAPLLETRVASEIIGIAAKDQAKAVRLEAIVASARLPRELAAPIVARALEREGEDLEVVSAAATAAGATCAIEALDALFDVLSRGAKPLAAPEEIGAAVAAAGAMGRIGGSEARRLLLAARERSNPTTDRAIDKALAALGEGCGASEAKGSDDGP